MGSSDLERDTKSVELDLQDEVQARREKGGQTKTNLSATLHGHSLVSLLELIQELKLSQDPFLLADTALLNLMGHLGTPHAALWMLSAGERDEPALLASHGFKIQPIKAVGSGFAAELRERFRTDLWPIDLRDPTCSLGSLAASLARANGIDLIAPLSSRGELRGWAALGKRVGDKPYGGFEREMLAASLDVLAVSLDNAVLMGRLRENNRRLRLANENLKELDRLKSDFMANMNHELRTPLTIVMAYLQSLQDEDMDKIVRREHVQLALGESQKLKALLTRLLDFSGNLQEGQTFPFELHELAPLLRLYCEERRPGISAELRELSLDTGPDPPRARFDERHLREILDHLVDNAVKFTPRGTRILMRLSSRQEGDIAWTSLEIEDDGPGIPIDRLPTLFEAFRQVDGSSTRAVGGMGVGLTLARRYAELLGGKLEVASELGSGTVFTLLLRAD